MRTKWLLPPPPPPPLLTEEVPVWAVVADPAAVVEESKVTGGVAPVLSLLLLLPTPARFTAIHRRMCPVSLLRRITWAQYGHAAYSLEAPARVTPWPAVLGAVVATAIPKPRLAETPVSLDPL